MYFSIYDESSTLPNEKLTGILRIKWNRTENWSIKVSSLAGWLNAIVHIFEYRIYVTSLLCGTFFHIIKIRTFINEIAV